MGNCISAQDKADKARSEAIDRIIEDNGKKRRKECKILVLGAQDTGKSTIVKQMKIIHQNGFTDSERMMFRPTIYRNTLDSAQDIVLAMHKINVDCVDPTNQANADRILDYQVEATPSFVFSEEIVKAIHQLWQDPIIDKVMDHSSEFYLMDSASYFFAEVLRIGAPDYLPTESDVLRARLKTMGVTETRFTMDQLQVHMFDVGGQRLERKKWIHCFESVTTIIFCAALSEYDQVLLEEKSQNRMNESLILFESVINSVWFRRTSIILFLNKIDVFKIKLPKVPLEKYFDDYTGGADINKAARYILRRFMHANRAQLSVHPHLTQATDTTNIRLVFAAVKETTLQNALKDSGIL
ncbi:guanine nucleotide binding protein, alpha subunit [Melanogaster broomeanus]|nr:guanine nucleotide binding protein, alpha subunit [Melanogaster broomeanus]